jgi:S1-C subfamily serine protease
MGKAQVIYWDSTTPGLGLRITQNQIKSYVFEMRVKGKTVRTTLGRFMTMQLEQAQAEALRLRKLAEEGIDPRGQSFLSSGNSSDQEAPFAVQLSLW